MRRFSPMGSISWAGCLPDSLMGFESGTFPVISSMPRSYDHISMVQKSTARNSEMIDTVHATAIELTNLTPNLQALVFMHADQIVQVLEITRPQIGIIPKIGKAIDSSLLSQTDELVRTTASGAKAIQSIVEDIQHTLIHSDAKRLRGYL